jgi:hypothetical protein
MSQGLPKEKILPIGEIPPAELYKKIIALTGKESHIIGIGNIAGKNQVWRSDS